MPEEAPSPSEEAGREAADGTTPPVDGSKAATEMGESRKQWFSDMRGWIVVLAVQVASSTYQAGLNPPSCFSDKGSADTEGLNPPSRNTTSGFSDKGSGDAETFDSHRYKVFFYSNTTAFLTSLAIIILLMNRSFYRSLAKVMVLEIIVVLDMIGLMAAYWAGSTRKDETNMFALVLTALVLFVVYVVYTVQLVRKLRDLISAVLRRRVARASTAPVVPDRQDDDVDGARAPPSLVLDVGRLKSELRRRGSQLLARTPQTGQSAMRSRLSPAAYLSPSPIPKSAR